MADLMFSLFLFLGCERDAAKAKALRTSDRAKVSFAGQVSSLNDLSCQQHFHWRWRLLWTTKCAWRHSVPTLNHPTLHKIVA